jgi:hypothetical protein
MSNLIAKGSQFIVLSIPSPERTRSIAILEKALGKDQEEEEPKFSSPIPALLLSESRSVVEIS